MEHKKVNFLHSVRLKMLLAMAFFAFVTGGFACALFISSTKEEIGSVTRGYMRDLSRAYGVMLDNELDTDGDDALSGEHLASILAGVQVEGVESSYIYVVSGDGTMLYHPTADKIGKPVENKAVSDAVAKIAKGEKVENEVVKYEFKGADKYAGIYVNDTQDFIMVVTADYDDVFSSIRKVEGKIGIIVLLELLIVATIGSVFAHIIVKPMNEVSELTVKVGDMDLTKNEIQTRLANRRDEIGRMGRSLDYLTQSLKGVVENIKEVMAIENTGQFRGVYHVLGGIISPMDGIGPSDLRIDSLVRRVAEGEVKEIILALSTTMEGDTTNFFIYRKLSGYDVRISVIARGVSIGDEIEYADEITLGRSIINRTEFNLTSSNS